MIKIAQRNLKIFFRDKSAVFFSLLASFIIIGLYVLFLGDVWASNFKQAGVNVREVMDNWIMAGLLAVTTVTTTMGAFDVMVSDKTKKINKDFLSSPVSRRSLAGGYVLSAFLIGLIMSMVTLVLAEAYIVMEGGALMDLKTLAKVIGVILIADLANTSMVFFLTSFFTSAAAFGTASTIIGTLIGFLTGIYLPIGTLPEAVQWAIKLFPPSHAAALLRQIMMEKPIATAFANAPAEYVEETKEMMGVTFKFGGTELGAYVHIAVLLGAGALFFVLAVVSMSRKRR